MERSVSEFNAKRPASSKSRSFAARATSASTSTSASRAYLHPGVSSASSSRLTTPQRRVLNLNRTTDGVLPGMTSRLERIEHPRQHSTGSTHSSKVRRYAFAQQSSDGSSSLFRSADSIERSMLKSIAELRLGMRQTSRSFDECLYEHEFEDLSEEEVEVSKHSDGTTSETGRRPSLVRQTEFSDDSIRKRTQSAVPTNRHLLRELEDRAEGFRHEKTSSTQRSQQSTEFNEHSISGLIYDADFDCYYNPVDEQYYKIVAD